MARPLREGVAGLQDGSSRPHRLHRPPPPSTAERIEALRRQRFTGQQIAQELGVSSATVSRVLRRLGLNRIAALEPTEPVRRYERERPGELIHIDIKKLGRFEQIAHRITGDRTGQSNFRGVGWEYPSPCRRRPFPTGLFRGSARRERRGSYLRFLFSALRFFRRHGVAVERVMTDNGSAFKSRQLRQGASPARHQAQADPALHAQNQRQGRALRANLVARVGLCKSRRHIRAAPARTRRLRVPV